LLKVVIQKDLVERGAVPTITVRVADIIDTDPCREKRVGGFPWCLGGRRLVSVQELVDLVDQREHRGLIRLNKSRVDGCTAVGKVVREGNAGVVLDSREINPVRV